jgi:GAF domain-containing protein
LNQELTKRVWQDFLRTSGVSRSLSLIDGQPHPDSAWTPTMETAAKGDVVHQVKDGETLLALPLQVRGQVVGVVEVVLEDALTSDDVASMRELAQRLAMSLENARLYDVAQAATAQEQRLNDIAARYEQVGSIDELLRITLNELGETLGAQHAAIRLGELPPETVHGARA